MAHENVIEMRDITKVFGGFIANDKINLHLRKGEIHALLGENGAGKSTLMNMLAGLLEPTSGEIAVNGQVVNLDSPSKAASLGIGMVHQHFMLVEAFTVAENIILGSELTKNGVLDIAGASKEIKALSERYGLAVDPSAKVADISVGAQQRVEILKTLYRGADILIFDEPTAVLTPSEIDELMAIMKNLVKEGKSIILITHKLDEIRAVSDRVTVIHRGKSIETVEIAGATNADLAEMMVGRSVSFKTEKQASKPKEVVLSIKDLVVNENRGVPAVKNLSLDVRAGEIVGIAGIDGNGQSELIQAITGLRKVESGSIELKGDSIVGLHPRQITELSVGHVPEDRHRDGLILEMMISENIALQTYYKEPHSKNGILNYSNITSYAKKLMEEFDVRAASELVPAAALSGGNQQKAIIAREIDRDPDLLIVSQPTRGLDVGAIEYIHKRLIEERDNGKAVLVVSFELDEILNVSDRIAVIHDGKIQGIVSPETTNKQELGVLMAGGIVGAIPGILRAYLGTSEVIVTIMMNYIVLYVGNAFIHAFPKDFMQSTDSTIRVGANATYQTPWLAELTGNSRMNIGIFFAIIAVAVIWFMLKKTTLGFEIRAVGLNPHASEYAGISAKRTIILSMIISGALAGLGGAVEGLGTFQNVYVQGSSLAIGFNGMAVSLLAANSPIGILFAAFLFGVLQVGAPGMNAAQVPSELVSIVTASIIFFVSVHYLIERFVKPKKQVKGGK